MRSRNRRSSWRHVLAGTAAICMGLLPSLVGVTPRAGAAEAPVLRGGGSIEEAWSTGGGAGDSIALLRNGSVVKNTANPGRADDLGSLIIRNLTPGSGYAWHDRTTGATTARFSVLAPGANPPRVPRCTPPSRCTRGSTTSPCVTASRWRPRCATPTTAPAVPRHPVRPSSSTRVTARPVRPTPFRPCWLGPARPVHRVRRQEPATRQCHRCRGGGRPGVGLRHGEPPDAGHRLLGRRLRPARLPVGL